MRRSGSRFSSGPRWSPQSIPGNILDLHAGKGITLVSTLVSAWADQSPAGNDFAQGTSTLRPLWSATGGPASNPTVDFRGLTRSEGLVSGAVAMAAATGLTFAVVMNYDDVTSSPIWLEMSTAYSSNTGASAITYANAASQQRMNTHDASAIAIWGSTAMTLGQWYRNVCTHDLTLSASEARIYLDDVQNGAVVGGFDNDLTGTFGDFAWYLGGRGATHTFPLDGQISQVVAYNRVLSAAERALLDAYFVSEWGL